MSEAMDVLRQITAQQPCSPEYENYLAELQAHLDAVGLAIMPKEPTREMIYAGAAVAEDAAHPTWTAMFEAARKPRSEIAT